MLPNAEMVPKEYGFNQSETACGLRDVFHARLQRREMVNL